MRFSSSIITLAAPLAALAAPARFYGKRAAADTLVFQFADVLEQLENSFYTTALSKFQESDFQTAGFTSSAVPTEQFTVIMNDESTHSTTLQAAIQSFGAQPITSCSFNFDSALTDVTTMAATARVVENLGVAAYIGGATLLSDPRLLSAAAGILTVEARHQTILNVLSGTGTAIPSAFDIGFTPSEVLAVASPFISGCDLGIPANPTLTITNTGTVAPGTLLTFQASTINGTIPDDQLFCQMMIGGAGNSIALPLSQCIVPDGINGPVAIWVTSDGQPLINNVKDRDTIKQVAGPTMAFIDTVPQQISSFLRSSSGSSSSGSGTDTASAGTTTETSTITPDEASSIIAGASSTASAPASTDTAAAEPGNAASGTSTSTSAGPNTSTGPSPDGKITVNGWTNLPGSSN